MKNKLILLLILSVSIFAYFDVYATNGYREIYSHEYYENTDGGKLYYDLCATDDGGYAILYADVENDTVNLQINILRYDKDGNLLYESALDLDISAANEIIGSKLLALPDNRLLVIFPSKVAVIGSDGKVNRVIEYNDRLNGIARLGDECLISIVNNAIFKYDFDFNLLSSKNVEICENGCGFLNNSIYDLSVMSMSSGNISIFDITSDLSLINQKNLALSAESVMPLAKTNNGEFIFLTSDGDSNYNYSVISSDLKRVLLNHKVFATAVPEFALNFLLVGMIGGFKYVSGLDDGYAFINQIPNADTLMGKISVSFYDNNYQLVSEEELLTLPLAAENNISSANIATIVMGMTKLKNGDLVVILNDFNYENNKVIDIVFSNKYAVNYNSDDEYIYFDNQKYGTGETVKINFKKKEGYVVDKIIVKDSSGNIIDVDMDDYTFVMPNSDITVEVQWRKDSPIENIINNPSTGALLSTLLCIIAIMLIGILNYKYFKKKV